MLKNKKWIIKFLTAFVLIISMLLNKNIFAKDLKYMANVKDSIAYIRSFVKRQGKRESTEWSYYSQSNGDTDSGIFTTYAMSFWGNKVSANYVKQESVLVDGDGLITVVSYDSHNGYVKAESENPEEDLPSYTAVGPHLITKNSNSADLVFELTGETASEFEAREGYNDESVYFYRYRSKTHKVSDDYSIAVQDWAISKSGLKKLVEKYYSGTNKTNRTYVDEATGCLKIRFSNNLHTYWPIDSNYSTIQHQYLENAYLFNRTVHIGFYDTPDTEKIYANQRRYTAYNVGYNTWLNVSWRTLVTGTSMLNYYDNWLYIPIAKLYPRTVTIKYLVKNDDGSWQTVKTEEKDLSDSAQTIAKSSINDKVSGIDSYYIGGKMASGTTKANAQTNFSKSTNTWGWDTTNISIPAASSEEHYVVELYYGKRDIVENHKDLSGNALVTATTHKIGLKDALPLYAKADFVQNGYKYKYQHYKIDSGAENTAKTATISAVSGGSALKLTELNTKNVTFYYKKLSQRTLKIKYLVRNSSGGWDEVKTETKEFWEIAQSFAKSSIGDNDKYYLGGKIGSGTTTANAQTDLSSSPDSSWGWNTTSISIPATEDTVHYVVELYYGTRNVVEKHVDLSGNAIVSDKTHSIGVGESLPLSSRSDLNNDENKYIYQHYKINSGTTNTGNTATINAIDGSTTLNLNALNSQTVTFYYKKIGKRRLVIKYLVKNSSGSWDNVKSETKEFWETAQSYTKSSIGDNDKYYIGGKQSSGSTLAQAESNISSTSSSWGWNTTNISIPASENATYYVVEFYYDYRNISEYHLKSNGQVINSTWNKTHKLLTKDEITLSVKTPPVYYNNVKYVHAKTEADGNTFTAPAGKQVNFSGLSGATALKFGDTHYVKFYYEYEPVRKVYVRHFVFNDTSGKYEIVSYLTNSKAAIKDSAENKYYLRDNGYNQRKYKSGSAGITDAIEAGYNEQYSIDFSDTIRLDKSRTIENEGVLYEYKGVKIEDVSTNILTTKAQADTLDKTKTTVILTPEAVKETYVDFYYTKSDILMPGEDPGEDPDEPTDSPKIDFVPQDEDETELGGAEENEGCKTVYVPSGENLKSYILATTYRPYSLIYEAVSVNETTGEMSYSLKKYDAYKFVDGIIQNNSSSNYGYINSTEKYGVFNTNSNTAVNPIYSVIDDVLKNSVSGFQTLNPNGITVVSDGRLTTEADYGNNNIHEVKSDKYNGIRKPAGTAYYNVTSLVKNGVVVFEQKIAKTAVSTANDTQVNVYTPAAIKEVQIESEKVVNHSNQDSASFVIQKNSEFKVTPIAGQTTAYVKKSDSTNLDTKKYIKYYWFAADFDIKLLDTRTVYDKDSKNITTLGSGQIVRAGNLIQIPVDGSLKAVATNDDESGDIINQFSNKLKVVAITYNVTDIDFEKAIISTVKADSSSVFVDNNSIRKVETTTCETDSTTQNHSTVYSVTGIEIGALQVDNMYDDAHYLVEKTETSKNIGRIYDFKVTDCLDVNFKNVFRKSNDGNVNDLRGIKYFSGIRRLLVYGGNGVQLGANQSNKNNIFNDITTTDDTINSVAAKTILPLGPYKHIDANYLQAPKLGYRISFDLKTSGVYVKSSSTERYIKITPSYYYISKDGKTYKDNIALYYKNSSGKYVNFEGSGYTIYFKPNDGYRTSYNVDAPELIDMSTKLEALKIGGTTKNGVTDSSFILTDSMMSYSSNNFVQAWYGEFKLPNSTIVVEVDASGKKDINNPLTDGYIGVRFEIECVDKENASMPENEAIIISYSQDDKSAGSSSTNTSQWDYEGYLGFATSNIGSNLNSELRIQLEKDVWKINTQDMYKKIKGTVVLFDIDNRAANDFD